MSEPRKTLPVYDTLSVSWQLTHGVKKSIWAALTIIFVIAFGFEIVVKLTENVPVFSKSVAFIHTIVQYLLQTGIIYIAIKQVKGEPVKFDQMFRAFDYDIMIRLLGVYVIQIVLFLPLFVLVILGSTLWFTQIPWMMCASVVIEFILGMAVLYLMLRISLAQLFTLDQGTNSWQAIKNSFAATRCNFWNLLAVRVLLSLIVMVSLIPLGIGLIWTAPMACVCVAQIYKTLGSDQP